jgi:hypothetical protein
MATTRTPARRTTAPAAADRPTADEVARQLSGAARAVADAASELAGPLGAAPSTDLVSELNNIDFRKMIGGPLQAAVDAQVASALMPPLGKGGERSVISTSW